MPPVPVPPGPVPVPGPVPEPPLPPGVPWPSGPVPCPCPWPPAGSSGPPGAAEPCCCSPRAASSCAALGRRLLRGALHRGPDQGEPGEQQRQQGGQHDQQPLGQDRKLEELAGDRLGAQQVGAARLLPGGFLPYGLLGPDGTRGPHGGGRGSGLDGLHGRIGLGGLHLERPGDRLTEPDQLGRADLQLHLGRLAGLQPLLSRCETEPQLLPVLLARQGDVDRGVPLVLHGGTEAGAQPAPAAARLQLGAQLVEGLHGDRALRDHHRLRVLRGQDADGQRGLARPDLVRAGRGEGEGHRLGGARVERDAGRLDGAPRGAVADDFERVGLDDVTVVAHGQGRRRGTAGRHRHRGHFEFGRCGHPGTVSRPGGCAAGSRGQRAGRAGAPNAHRSGGPEAPPRARAPCRRRATTGSDKAYRA